MIVPAGAGSDTAPGSRLHALRVMFVDSHAVNRMDGVAILRAAGHNVLAVDSGAAALAALPQFPCDLVVTELLMPDMDGLELIIRIRNARHPVVILAVCDGDRPYNIELLRHARTFGADATLVRPCLPGQFADAVARAFGDRP